MPKKILSRNKFSDTKLVLESSEGRRATLKSAGCLFQVITNKTRSFKKHTCLWKRLGTIRTSSSFWVLIFYNNKDIVFLFAGFVFMLLFLAMLMHAEANWKIHYISEEKFVVALVHCPDMWVITLTQQRKIVSFVLNCWCYLLLSFEEIMDFCWWRSGHMRLRSVTYPSPCWIEQCIKFYKIYKCRSSVFVMICCQFSWTGCIFWELNHETICLKL